MLGATVTRWMKSDNLICGIGCIIFIVLSLCGYCHLYRCDLSGITPYILVLVAAAIAIGLTTLVGLLEVSVVIFVLVEFESMNDS